MPHHQRTDNRMASRIRRDLLTSAEWMPIYVLAYQIVVIVTLEKIIAILRLFGIASGMCVILVARAATIHERTIEGGNIREYILYRVNVINSLLQDPFDMPKSPMASLPALNTS